MTDTLYLDIETLPSNEEWAIEYAIKDTKPPATIKKQDTLEKWWLETFPSVKQEKIRNLALYGATNRILCIGYAKNDEEPTALYAKGDSRDDEANILEGFFQFFSSEVPLVNRVVGHNITGFDMNIIKQRAIVHGLETPVNMQFDCKPWDMAVYDTMYNWDNRNKVSLDLLTKALGVETPKDGDIDGSKVYDYYMEGRHEEIAEYCKRDVVAVREVYKKMVKVIR